MERDVNVAAERRAEKKPHGKKKKDEQLLL